MSTIRKVIEFPRLVQQMRERIDPLDNELTVIRNINWELNKLPNDESVARCVQFLMTQRGFVMPGDLTNVDDEMHETRGDL